MATWRRGGDPDWPNMVDPGWWPVLLSSEAPELVARLEHLLACPEASPPWWVRAAALGAIRAHTKALYPPAPVAPLGSLWSASHRERREVLRRWGLLALVLTIGGARGRSGLLAGADLALVEQLKAPVLPVLTPVARRAATAVDLAPLPPTERPLAVGLVCLRAAVSDLGPAAWHWTALTLPPGMGDPARVEADPVRMRSLGVEAGRWMADVQP